MAFDNVQNTLYERTKIPTKTSDMTACRLYFYIINKEEKETQRVRERENERKRDENW